MTKKEQKQKDILMVTRPICLPWDEASKNFAWEISKRLNNKNRRFHLLTYKNLPYTFKSIIEHPIYSNKSLRLSKKEKLKLLKFLLLNKEPIDIMHFLFTPSENTTKIVKKFILPRYDFRYKNKEKSLKTVQTVATLDFKKITKENVLDYLFASRIVTHSRHTKDFLNNKGLKNVTHIYPGIDTDKFKPRLKDKGLLKKLGILYHDKVILYTGEYVRLQAADMIVKAFHILTQKYNNLKLIFACRIKSKEDIEKKETIDLRFKKLGISGKVIFLETFNEMEKLYNLANIFLFPVKKMTGKFDIALTILEAMASKLPVIISDVGALQEVIQVKNSAVVLKEKSAIELASQISLILNDKNLENKLKNNARKNVERHFDINVCAKEYKKLYNEIT